MMHIPTPPRLSALALLLPLATSRPLLQAQSIQQLPPAAYSVGLAYDVARERLVLFGGYAGGRYLGDTWEWDGSAWTRLEIAGPPARNSPTLVYDAARRVIVMFGGDTRATGALGDTWLFDGTRWREVQVPGPPPRTTTAMVYDARRERVVLFGGASGTTVFGDTWEWDGRAWTRVAGDGPSARTLFGMAWDAARGRTVLFGGTSVVGPDAPSHGDTWEWDGGRWTQVATGGVAPSARDHIAMDFDAARRVVVMHGGGTGPVDPGETWSFDGRAWRRVTAEGPRRRFARLAYDPRALALLLFGGFDRAPSNELWRWDGRTWMRLAP